MPCSTPAVTTALTGERGADARALLLVLLARAAGGAAQGGRCRAQTGGALALIVWYALVCVLAAVHYTGWIVPIAMLVGYVCILRSLLPALQARSTRRGYAITPQPVRVTDRCIALVLAAALGIGCTLGYLFGSSYRMDWQPADASEQTQTAAIRQQLLDLGFPEAVLNDLTPEDIAACDGALRVVAVTEDHPFNDGRTVSHKESDGEGGVVSVLDTVYDVRELRLTSVGVQLPGAQETWRVFHHFLWTTDPGFYGTEVLQIWSADQNTPDGWRFAGDVTGRVLYDRGGQTFTAPYALARTRGRYTANSVFFGRADEYRPVRRLFPAAACGALPRLCRLLHRGGARRLYPQQRSVLHPPAELAAVPRRNGDGKTPDDHVGRLGRISHRAGCAAV
ncbi:MAG: hypothetical protein ACLUNO_01490 [Oscillospiraceae bacterium]